VLHLEGRMLGAGSGIFAKDVASTEGSTLDQNLSRLKHTMLSAMAEKMFDDVHYSEDTTDSECEDMGRTFTSRIDWRLQAHTGLLPLVGESATHKSAHFNRELFLPGVPKDPLQLLGNESFHPRPRHSFEDSGFSLPRKKRRGCDQDLATRTELTVDNVGGNLVEVMDEDGQIVELREQPGRAQLCCYINCPNPTGPGHFKKVRAVPKNGLSDSSREKFVGRTLCGACHSRLTKRGTLSVLRDSTVSNINIKTSARVNAMQSDRNLRPMPPPRRECCQVCFDESSIPSLKCSTCSIPVHEQCYLGCERVPTTQRTTWQCDPCSLSLETRELGCQLCPVSGGAFKRAACGATFQWAHLACAILIPGAAFAAAEQL
jgi:hypothetical protein